MIIFWLRNLQLGWNNCLKATLNLARGILGSKKVFYWPKKIFSKIMKFSIKTQDVIGWIFLFSLFDKVKSPRFKAWCCSQSIESFVKSNVTLIRKFTSSNYMCHLVKFLDDTELNSDFFTEKVTSWTLKWEFSNKWSGHWSWLISFRNILFEFKRNVNLKLLMRFNLIESKLDIFNISH